jgi:uncharacterized protein
MDSYNIIKKYYKPGTKAYKVLTTHSKSVARKALQVAKRVPELRPDLKFIYEAAMLHDIGMIKTNAGILGCFGKHKYIEHGVLGRKMLEKEGLPKHAKVCERHVGVGITAKDVVRQKLPLPKRSMIPRTVDEKIIAFADKFFSKNPAKSGMLTVDQIKSELAVFGAKKVKTFDKWCKLFKERK